MSLLSNTRSVTRSLSRSPAVTVVVIVLLSFAIGINTAFFAIFEELSLQELPVTNPDRLFWVTTHSPDRTDSKERQSYAFFKAVQQSIPESKTIEGVAAVSERVCSVGHEGAVAYSRYALVTGSYFPTLGIRPMLGRLIEPSDNVRGIFVVVLAYHYWNRQFGGDPSVIGRTLLLNGEPYRVIGVGPRGFSGTTKANPVDLWTPIAATPSIYPGFGAWNTDIADWIQLLVRLRPGAQPVEGELIATLAYRKVAENRPEVARRRMMETKVTLAPAAKGRLGVDRRYEEALLVVLGTALVLLLTTCLNVGCILFARSARREKHFSIRRALGATERSIAEMVWVEVGLLTALAVTGGLLVAQVFSSVTAALLGVELELRFNWTILTWALGLSALTIIVSGVFPAMRGRTGHAVVGESLLGLQSASEGKRGRRWQKALIVGQVALALPLLFAAAALLRTLNSLYQTNVGFITEDLYQMKFAPRLFGVDPSASGFSIEPLLDRLTGHPGVSGAALSSTIALSGSTILDTVEVDHTDSKLAGQGIRCEVTTVSVSHQYFRTMGVPVLLGRDFGPFDRPESLPVVIVNRAFATSCLGTSSLIGRRLKMKTANSDAATSVVGVVGNSVLESVRQGVAPALYFPAAQRTVTSGGLYIRSRLKREEVAELLRREMWALDDRLPVYGFRSLGSHLREQLRPERTLTSLVAIFGFSALCLVAAGSHGIVSYALTSRVKSLAIRRAHGATDVAVLLGMSREVFSLVAGGLLIGSVGVLAIRKILISWNLAVDEMFLPTYLGCAATLTIASIAAAMGPTRKALRTSPSSVLREE